MKCPRPSCKYEWKARTKSPRACPNCKQYLRYGSTNRKECAQCSKEIVKRDRDTQEQWDKKQFCSSECYGLFMRGKSRTNVGEKNGQWKGDKVGLSALHEYIGNRLIKPKACEMCGKEKPLDLANISQEYKRELTDWEWLCRTCHMTKDGRLVRARKNMLEAKQYLLPKRVPPKSPSL